MRTLNEMYRHTTSCKEFDKMIQSTTHFSNYFGLNHIYYTRLLSTGEFSSIGTHKEWHEFSFDKSEVIEKNLINTNFHEQHLVINQNISSNLFSSFDKAKNQYDVNFTICINRKSNNGIQSFGFAAPSQNNNASALLLRELSLVDKFIDHFLEVNKKLIEITHDNQVMFKTLSPVLQKENKLHLNHQKDKYMLLCQLGLGDFKELTPRETDIIFYLAEGFPASYIANELHLSTRTIQNHIASIKSKLQCNCKSDLIKIARNYKKFCLT